MMKTTTDLFIQHFSFWPHLTEAQRAFLNDHTRPVRYGKGTAVQREMGDCLGVLLVKKGQLRAYALSEDGRDVTLHRFGPDEVSVMTATCSLEAVTFRVFIDAVEDTEALLTDAEAFRRLAEENIYVRCFGYERAATSLSEMLWQFQQVLFLSVDRRLALFLQEESQHHGPAIRLTHEQIARNIGSAREVVSRLLKCFSQEGLVAVSRGSLYILNAERLKQIAGVT